jgi:hypothetical protein
VVRAGAAGFLGIAFWTGGDLEAAHRAWSECVARLEQAGYCLEPHSTWWSGPTRRVPIRPERGTQRRCRVRRRGAVDLLCRARPSSRQRESNGVGVRARTWALQVPCQRLARLGRGALLSLPRRSAAP